jgi:hypothetical protein
VQQQQHARHQQRQQHQQLLLLPSKQGLPPARHADEFCTASVGAAAASPGSLVAAV